MTWKPCRERLDLASRVTLTCDRPLGEGHDGAHHDPVYGLRWKADEYGYEPEADTP